MVFQAHNGQTTEMGEAQTALMMRYGGAVHRYLLGALRDPDAAEELDQEFALRFLRGDFRNVDPSKGRFRDFVKRSLRNLMIDFHRRKRVRPRPIDSRALEISDEDPAPKDFERRFLKSWRDELMSRAWEALHAGEVESGQPLHTVLRYRADHPEQHSPEMAESLSKLLGRTVSAGWVRQMLYVSRDRFLNHLIQEIEGSMENPTKEEVQEEMITLGLLEYCRPALKRRGYVS